jgi:hypothetical protein
MVRIFIEKYFLVFWFFGFLGRSGLGNAASGTQHHLSGFNPGVLVLACHETTIDNREVGKGFKRSAGTFKQRACCAQLALWVLRRDTDAQLLNLPVGDSRDVLTFNQRLAIRVRSQQQAQWPVANAAHHFACGPGLRDVLA